MVPKDEKVALGRRIRELREGAGQSRELLAEAVGLSVRAVVQWKLDEREPGWFNIQALGQARSAWTAEPSLRRRLQRLSHADRAGQGCVIGSWASAKASSGPTAEGDVIAGAASVPLPTRGGAPRRFLWRRGGGR
jgi:DNA-binding XRE family transcriptional regulator